MTKTATETITFELCGHDMDDGRIYICSETLKGFHYIIDSEDQLESLTPTIAAFMGAYLNAEVNKVKPAMSPKAYRQRGVSLAPRLRHLPFVAEVRNAIAA